jgi:hypothetical protein
MAGGKVVDCKRDAKDRASLGEFLAAQQRFVHLIERDRNTGEVHVKPGRKPYQEAFRSWVQTNVERLYQLAELKS